MAPINLDEPEQGTEDATHPGTDGSNDNEDDGSEELAKVHATLEPDPMLLAAAAEKLTRRLQAKPEDSAVLHNLGAVLSEMGHFEEAEERFLQAAEVMKKDNKASEATMYGLAMAMNQQDTMPKLMQAEAIFRDLLERALAKGEKGVMDMYRAYVSLAMNFEKQKRWKEAAMAWSAAVQLASNMFGPEHEGVLKQRAALMRAERLAKWQRIIRTGMWSVTIGVPVFAAWFTGRFETAWAFLGFASPAVNATTATAT
mmetsp:Transcript_65657/g.182696  ORF Transcript_65657/g.182696 Transcript_65657/m.182696 type:complete len:256 (-) Transcript_65657:120-887(-)